MDVFLIFLLALGLLLGAIFGWVSLFQHKNVSDRLKALEKRLASIEAPDFQTNHSLQKTWPSSGSISQVEKSDESQPGPVELSSQKEQIAGSSQGGEQIQNPRAVKASRDDLRPTHSADSQSSPSPLKVFINSMGKSMQENWMVWVGGMCIALAGIFLARYAMQRGILGPEARIAAGLLTGFSLHAAAEYFRRKTGDIHPAFAALAGGGSITLFACLLAALHMYEMFPPMAVFVALAIIALGTMWLACIHGPVLAIIGILGAYTLPLLVFDGDGNMVVALGYISVISASALMLLRYVFRIWLFFGLLAGALGWWYLSLFNAAVEGWQGLYLGLFAYCLLSIQSRDFGLSHSVGLPEKLGPLSFWLFSDPMGKLLPTACVLVVLAQSISISMYGISVENWWAWMPLWFVFLRASTKREQLTVIPWLLAATQFIALLLNSLEDKDSGFELAMLDHEALSGLIWILLVQTVVACGVSLKNKGSIRYQHWWASLATLAPVTVVLLLYLLAPYVTSKMYWLLGLVFLGASQLLIAHILPSRKWPQAWPVWSVIAGHFYYSLAAVIFLDRGGLTLALAAQAISISWIYGHYKMTELSWFLKGCLGVVAIRLTLNPWLSDYPTTEHWTLWTYGGSFLCGLISWKLLEKKSSLASWSEAACAHLLVLFAWVEVRYFLNEGVVFSSDFSLAEVSINTALFSALALVYNYKISVGEFLGKLYRFYSRGLMLLALGNYGIILLNVLTSSHWAWSDVSETPVLNILLIALGLPVVMAYLVGRYVSGFRRFSYLLSVVAAFIFVSMEIRHLWQGSIRLDISATDVEIYTYSLVWFLFAVVAIVVSSFKYSKTGYRGGMWLLVAVILKVFLIDMSQLEGVYRIISFMGLGIGLLGLSYLHQQLKNRLEEMPDQTGIDESISAS